MLIVVLSSWRFDVTVVVAGSSRRRRDAAGGGTTRDRRRRRLRRRWGRRRRSFARHRRHRPRRAGDSPPLTAVESVNCPHCATISPPGIVVFGLTVGDAFAAGPPSPFACHRQPLSCRSFTEHQSLSPLPLMVGCCILRPPSSIPTTSPSQKRFQFPPPKTLLAKTLESRDDPIANLRWGVRYYYCHCEESIKNLPGYPDGASRAAGKRLFPGRPGSKFWTAGKILSDFFRSRLFLAHFFPFKRI